MPITKIHRIRSRRVCRPQLPTQTDVSDVDHFGNIVIENSSRFRQDFVKSGCASEQGITQKVRSD